MKDAVHETSSPDGSAFAGDIGCDARLEVHRDALDVVGLAREIELLGEEPFDLVVVGVEPLHGHEPLHDHHDAADRHEIQPHHLVDVFVLDLHRDAQAVFRLRLVDLAERRARDARAVEVLEQGALEIREKR